MAVYYNNSCTVAMSNPAVHKNSEAAQLSVIICISGYVQPIALPYFNPFYARMTTRLLEVSSSSIVSDNNINVAEL